MIAGPYLLPDILGDIGGGHKRQGHRVHRMPARIIGPASPKPETFRWERVEFVNGISAMSASGGYGPARVAAAIVGHADLRLGEKVQNVLEQQIALTGGRMRGIRWSIPYDASEVGQHVSRFVAEGISRDADLARGLFHDSPGLV